MIVCHCEVVSDREVAAAVADGARTLSQVCRRTGAGTNCGGCVFSLKRLLCQHDVNQSVSQSVSLSEVDVAAS